MKNVSILIPTLDSGGAEKQAVLLAVSLSKHTDVNMIVLYGEHTEYKKNVDFLSQSNVNVLKLSGNIFSKIQKVKEFIKVSNTGVLLNYLTMPDFVGSIIGRLAGITVYNGIRNSRLPKGKMFLEKFAHNMWATGTIYNCYSGAEYFGKLGFSRHKNIVIPNCFPDIADPLVRENAKVKTIITVGRFDPQKDYETLIRSVAELRRDDFRLKIVGYGELEGQVRKWVSQFGISDKTDIYIKPDNVVEMERNADIYISTSLFEGTSNSIMEALNWSLPVVATNVGDNSYLVKDGENGFLHSVGDVNGISGSLACLLDSVELRNTMGIRGNRNLRENYSVETFEKRYIDLLEKVS